MSNRLYVGNIPFGAGKETLRDLFESDSRNVRDVFVVTDRTTGKSRGFAFVTLGSAEEAQEAIQVLDGAELDGREIRVNEAYRRPDRR